MPRTFQCVRCDTVWSSETELKNHIEEHHKPANSRENADNARRKRSRTEAATTDTTSEEKEGKEDGAIDLSMFPDDPFNPPGGNGGEHFSATDSNTRERDSLFAHLGEGAKKQKKNDEAKSPFQAAGHSSTVPGREYSSSIGDLWHSYGQVNVRERRGFDASELLLDVLKGEGSEAMTKTSTTEWIGKEISPTSFQHGKLLTQIRTGQPVLSTAKELWPPLITTYGDLGEDVKPMIKDSGEKDYRQKPGLGKRANQA